MLAHLSPFGRRLGTVLLALLTAAALTACDTRRTEVAPATTQAVADTGAEGNAPAQRTAHLAETTAPVEPGPPMADQVVVLKGDRRLLLLDDGAPFATFQVALGRNPEGPKRREGDGRTPEGRYHLDWRNPESEYYRSIHISYPAPRDVARAEAAGVDPGNNIMIHGLPPEWTWMGEHHRLKDWTEGCIAVTNAEMDFIWNRVPDGTPIEIRP